MVTPNTQTRSQTTTITRPQMDTWVSPPPLNPGDHLSRAEFERRYHAHPEIKKAELIEGVVYMPSPIRHDKHSQPHAWMVGWLVAYVAATSGVDVGDNATVRLDLKNEVQPDAFLRLEPEYGGKSHLAEDGYLEGPPELVVEVSASSASYDLHAKRRVYTRSGVQEYVAVQMYEGHLDWFILREGSYETLRADEEGIVRSETFPGLWLDGLAFWEGDLAAMLDTLKEGLASQEHADFVARLQQKKSKHSDV